MPTNIQTVTLNLRHYQSINGEQVYILLFILHEWKLGCANRMILLKDRKTTVKLLQIR